jgi:hypothetical protein
VSVRMGGVWGVAWDLGRVGLFGIVWFDLGCFVCLLFGL